MVKTDGTMSKLGDQSKIQSDIQSKREDQSKILSNIQSKTKKVTHKRTAPPGFRIRWSKLS